MDYIFCPASAFLKNDTRKKFGEIIYLMAFGLYALGSWLSSTGFNSFFGIDYKLFSKLFFITALILIAVKVCLQEYRVRDIAVILVILVLFSISSVSSGSRSLLWVLVFVVAAQGVSIGSIALVLTIVLGITALVVFPSYTVGIIPEYAKGVGTERGIHHSFGFSHPNTLATFIFTLYLCLTVLRIKKLSYKDVLLGIIFLLIEYFITDSRTITLCFLLVIGALILKITKRKSILSVIKKTLPFLIIVIAVASIVAMIAYDSGNQYWALLDKAFSGRLKLMHGYYLTYGISPFGTKFNSSPTYQISIHGTEVTFLVDNLFANLVLTHGYLGGSAGIICLVLGLFILARNSSVDDLLLLFLGIFLIAGLFECIAIWVKSDIFLLLYSNCIYEAEKMGIREDKGHPVD